eukprot:TRINITY_DN2469_c0_g1_i11.p3 TRINITY_DN2469_c0_g1~~TRINITY_DN2469_c0_g1_i11.p3  ORF type:complete len:109 (+),score=34.11 TRINITY_DN2469_c0_g1_i11:255-581(+)
MKFDANCANSFFTYIADNSMPLENRLSAALFFKNTVNKYWNPEENDTVDLAKALDEVTKNYIKENLAKLLMMTPRKIGESLAAMSAVIGKVELHTEWPSFVPVFGSHL